MGYAYTGMANTPDAIYLNCAGLAQLNSTALSFNYVRPFGMKELAHFSFNTAIPTSWGHFAAGVSSFGNELYQEQTTVFGFSESISEKFFYGINFHYMKLQIKGYGSDYCYGIDVGFLVKLNPRLNWGFFTTNINRASIGKSDDLLPQSFSTGINIVPLERINLNVDLYKELPFPLELRAGIEYKLLDKIAVRGGFSTEPAQFCGGFGFFFRKIQCDYAVNTHMDLGLTHQFSIQLNF
ncbi:hypothetical protein B6I21_03760 [candidate division KSB1 bacterium 4572_119]|nr:MAG: hypothetical protein B6I21_03760 [candidate division KSB1 bacterium 4572_119]